MSESGGVFVPLKTQNEARTMLVPRRIQTASLTVDACDEFRREGRENVGEAVELSDRFWTRQRAEKISIGKKLSKRSAAVKLTELWETERDLSCCPVELVELHPDGKREDEGAALSEGSCRRKSQISRSALVGGVRCSGI